MTENTVLNEEIYLLKESNDNFFYTHKETQFYKSKLIHIEEIASTEKQNIGNYFEKETIYISYVLSFLESDGSIVKHVSSVKPKTIGKNYYYVLKNSFMVDIFSENDKIKLKKYIPDDIPLSSQTFYKKSIFSNFSEKISWEIPFGTVILTLFSCLTVGTLFDSTFSESIIIFSLLLLCSALVSCGFALYGLYKEESYNMKYRKLKLKEIDEEKDKLIKSFE